MSEPVKLGNLKIGQKFTIVLSTPNTEGSWIESQPLKGKVVAKMRGRLIVDLEGQRFDVELADARTWMRDARAAI